MSATRINPREWTEVIDGWYVRHLVDGRVEIHKDVSANLTFAQWGALWEAKVCDDVQYPFTFRSRPYTRVETYFVNGSAIFGYEITARTNQTTHFPTVFALRPSNVSNASIGVGLFATGWPPS